MGKNEGWELLVLFYFSLEWTILVLCVLTAVCLFDMPTSWLLNLDLHYFFIITSSQWYDLGLVALNLDRHFIQPS